MTDGQTGSRGDLTLPMLLDQKKRAEAKVNEALAEFRAATGVGVKHVEMFCVHEGIYFVDKARLVVELP